MEQHWFNTGLTLLCCSRGQPSLNLPFKAWLREGGLRKNRTLPHGSLSLQFHVYSETFIAAQQSKNMLHENCTGKSRALAELGECADKNQNGIASFEICHWKQTGERTQFSFPNSLADTGMAAIPRLLGAARTRSLGQQESWERAQGSPGAGTVPPALAPPQLCGTGTGGADSSPSTALSGIQGAADPQEAREAGRSLPSWEAQTTHAGFQLRACPGEFIYKVHWSSEPNLMYRIYYSKQQPCSSCWPLSALPAGGLQYPTLYNRLLPFSHGGK